MNPHIRKDNLRGGRYVSTTMLRHSRFAVHRRTAKILCKNVFLSIGIPKGVKIRFGEKPLTHFRIFDHLCDYYAFGDDFLPKKAKKKRDIRRERHDQRFAARRELSYY